MNPKKSITVDGVTYYSRGEPTTYKIVRSRDAGVFAGYLEARDGSTVVLTDARRIWRWAGAATLSELAQSGTSERDDCKFPAPVGRVEILGVCEILDTTEEARESIETVPVWSAQ